MNELKVGDWAIRDCNCTTKIHKIDKERMEDTDHREIHFEDIDYWYLAYHYRPATVYDYIRTTMSVEKMAMFLYDVNHGNTTINFHDYPNQEHIKWLNQPLTDNLVKQLERRYE